jgi:hypothetical protein
MERRATPPRYPAQCLGRPTPTDAATTPPAAAEAPEAPEAFPFVSLARSLARALTRQVASVALLDLVPVQASERGSIPAHSPFDRMVQRYPARPVTGILDPSVRCNGARATKDVDEDVDEGVRPARNETEKKAHVS